MVEEASSLSQRETKIRGRLDIEYVMLVAAVLIAGFCAVKLWRENSSLRLAMKKSPETLCGPQSVQVGDIVPPLNTVDTTGRPVNLGFNDSKKSLLIIFSAGCGTCVDQIPIWNRISVKAVSKKYVVLGISIDSLEDTQRSLSDKNFGFDILIMPNMPAARAYRVVSIPIVMIISARNTVEWFHYGAMGADEVWAILSKIENDS